MREIIANLLPYEWYVWLLTGFWSLIWIIIVVYKKTDTLLTNKQKEILGTHEEEENAEEADLEQWEEGILNPEADSLVQKLLQQTEIENEEEARFTDRIEELEREIENEEETQETQSNEKIERGTEEEIDPLIEEFRLVGETQINEDEEVQEIENNKFPTEIDLLSILDIEKSETGAASNETLLITPEIYNTNTNIETINKQKTQFETLKWEIEHLGKRGMSVEYEKKLIEATIDFPEDIYFNTLLGDYYIDTKDFKKAQTIYKKLHLQDALNDWALFKLGIINLELGDIQIAEFLLGKAKDLKPENPKYYQVLAEVKYNLEKIDESIELMEKAVDLRPNKFEYMEILGKLYKETDNIKLYYKTLLKMNVIEPMNLKVKAELNKFQEWNY